MSLSDPLIGEANGCNLCSFGFVGYDENDPVFANPTGWGIQTYGFMYPNFGATTTGWVFIDEKFFSSGWSVIG